MYSWVIRKLHVVFVIFSYRIGNRRISHNGRVLRFALSSSLWAPIVAMPCIHFRPLERPNIVPIPICRLVAVRCVHSHFSARTWHFGDFSCVAYNTKHWCPWRQLAKHWAQHSQWSQCVRDIWYRRLTYFSYDACVGANPPINHTQYHRHPKWAHCSVLNCGDLGHSMLMPLVLLVRLSTMMMQMMQMKLSYPLHGWCCCCCCRSGCYQCCWRKQPPHSHQHRHSFRWHRYSHWFDRLSNAIATTMSNYIRADCLPNGADANDPTENGQHPMCTNYFDVSKFPSNSDCHGIISVEVRRIEHYRPAWLSAEMCCRQKLCKWNRNMEKNNINSMDNKIDTIKNGEWNIGYIDERVKCNNS